MIPDSGTAGIEHSPESVATVNVEAIRAAAPETRDFDQTGNVARGYMIRSDQRCTTELPCPASAMNREHPGYH